MLYHLSLVAFTCDSSVSSEVPQDVQYRTKHKAKGLPSFLNLLHAEFKHLNLLITMSGKPWHTYSSPSIVMLPAFAILITSFMIHSIFLEVKSLRVVWFSDSLSVAFLKKKV